MLILSKDPHGNILDLLKELQKLYAAVGRALMKEPVA